MDLILDISEKTIQAGRGFYSMNILNHLKTDWFRYGFETLAVIVGILVAFALDNWNENRHVRNIERLLLGNLKLEI